MPEVERRGKYPGVKVHFDPEEIKKLTALADYLNVELIEATEVKGRKMLIKLAGKIKLVMEEDPSTLDERTPEEIIQVLEKERDSAIAKLAKIGAGQDWKKPTVTHKG